MERDKNRTENWSGDKANFGVNTIGVWWIRHCVFYDKNARKLKNVLQQPMIDYGPASQRTGSQKDLPCPSHSPYRLIRYHQAKNKYQEENMNVLVKQKKWTLLGRKYIVSVKEEKKYIVERISFSIKPEFEIKDFETWKLIGTIKNKIRFKADAIIKIGEREFEFKQEKLNTMTYNCIDKTNDDKYLIQGNSGNNVSAFKNGEQVGYWKKKSFVILEGNRYDLVQNFDDDPILLSSFAILVDNYKMSIRIGGGIGWELGNMGKGLTLFNENWVPKKARR